MKKYLIGAIVLIITIGAGDLIYGWYNPPEINDFWSCSLAQGSVIMESYPEQCRTRDGRVFINEEQDLEIPDEYIDGSTFSHTEAFEIAENSECVENGHLLDTYSYNEYTKTWWIDLEMYDESIKEGCSPACVVSEETGMAEINWRCTGLIPR